MNLQQRIDLLDQLGSYMLSEQPAWIMVKKMAEQKNAWFTQEFIQLSAGNISRYFLQKNLLQQWVNLYNFPPENTNPKTVGIVLAGNIPLVGFHDFLCVFISGHRLRIKLSAKDEVLLKHLVQKMIEWDAAAANYICFDDMLKGCDAYIATGSNNSGRYFDYYFARYPHIIRKNRTSVAILTGNEDANERSLLADDIHFYFGLGCRNVTKIYVPIGYDFLPLIEACKKYDYFFSYSKYKNNYDYQLALLLMNKVMYKSTGSLLLVEDSSLFTPVSVLHYAYYKEEKDIQQQLPADDVQCIIGKNYLPFGRAQQPLLTNYADGADTLRFLYDL